MYIKTEVQTRLNTLCLVQQIKNTKRGLAVAPGVTNYLEKKNYLVTWCIA